MHLFSINHFKPNAGDGKGASVDSVGSGSKKGGGGSSPANSVGQSAAATHQHKAGNTVNTTTAAAHKTVLHSSSTFSTSSSSTVHDTSPAESADKCSMCWFQFSLFRRAHHCRLCDALCCDDCSKKRCLIDYSQVLTNIQYVGFILHFFSCFSG